MSNTETKMDNKEKGLLLDLILRDIRGNWGWENGNRVGKAMQLATELNFPKTIALINSYDYEDGRHFREPFSNGGYEGMSIVHNLPETITDKSKEFQDEAVKYLTYPDNAFEDWEQFELTLYKP